MSGPSGYIDSAQQAFLRQIINGGMPDLLAAYERDLEPWVSVSGDSIPRFYRGDGAVKRHTIVVGDEHRHRGTLEFQYFPELDRWLEPGDSEFKNADDGFKATNRWLFPDRHSESLALFFEAGPSGYSAGQFNLEPMDPNDRVRQKTQARDVDYPYDSPPMYGSEMGVDATQTAHPTVSWTRPPVPRNKRPEDVGTRNVWDLAMEQLDTYEPGPQAPDASFLGYGNHGRMGDGLDPEELELAVLRQDFRDAFLGTMPTALSLPSRDLFSLLADLDPDYTADLFAPEDDSEMQNTYRDWGHRVYAPGAEDDPE